MQQNPRIKKKLAFYVQLWYIARRGTCMALSNLTVRLDENDKNKFSEICEKIGLSVSAAINVFVKKVVSEHKIPFELSDPFYSEENINALLAAKKRMDEGKYQTHNLDELNSLLMVADSRPKFGK